ncbi:MAG: hypothetical protein ACLROH_09995 [Streptococcus sp.]
MVQVDKESGLPEDNPTGLFQAYILPDIQEQDWERVGQAELMSLKSFRRSMNVSISASWENVNPEQDILGKPFDAYETYLIAH